MDSEKLHSMKLLGLSAIQVSPSSVILISIVGVLYNFFHTVMLQLYTINKILQVFSKIIAGNGKTFVIKYM